jgi:hypothetical protein
MIMATKRTMIEKKGTRKKPPKEKKREKQMSMTRKTYESIKKRKKHDREGCRNTCTYIHIYHSFQHHRLLPSFIPLFMIMN